jgi:hypothetical protein
MQTWSGIKSKLEKLKAQSDEKGDNVDETFKADLKRL